MFRTDYTVSRLNSFPGSVFGSVVADPGSGSPNVTQGGRRTLRPSHALHEFEFTKYGPVAPCSRRCGEAAPCRQALLGRHLGNRVPCFSTIVTKSPNVKPAVTCSENSFLISVNPNFFSIRKTASSSERSPTSHSPMTDHGSCG